MDLPAALPGLLSGDLIAQRWYAFIGRGSSPPDMARAEDADYVVRTVGVPLWPYLLLAVVIADLFGMAGIWLRQASGSSPNATFGWWALAGATWFTASYAMRKWLEPIYPYRPWLWADASGLSVRNRFHVPWSGVMQIQPVFESGKHGDIATALSVSAQIDGKLRHVSLRFFDAIYSPGNVYEDLRAVAARHGAVLQPLPPRALAYQRRHAGGDYARKF